MFLNHGLSSAVTAVGRWSVLWPGSVGVCVRRLGQLSSASSRRTLTVLLSDHHQYTTVPAGQRAHSNRNEILTTFTRQPVRQYARRVQKMPEFESQLQDLSPSMLKHEYASVPLAHTIDDVVKKLLSLEFASHSERLRLKEEQLIAKVQRHETDRSSTEVKVAKLTARIRNFQEHLHKHPKDKANKRWMLMSIDRRKKLLKYLRRTRYSAFEKVCEELGITYTFPPEYYRRATRRWLAKKALCIKVFNEVQRQKKEKINKALAQKVARSTNSNHTESQGTPV